MKLRNTLLSLPADGAWLNGQLSHAPDVCALALSLHAGEPHPTHIEESITAALQQAGFATLTLDLLTQHENEHDPDAGFNVSQLADRLLAVATWIGHQPVLTALPISLVTFGTASGAAVRAAAKAPQEHFSAFVCLGGRPDLAGAGPLRALALPTRFIVGDRDPGSAMLRQAYALLTCQHDWKRIDGGEIGTATDSAIGLYAHSTVDWLLDHLPPPAQDESASATTPNADTI